jgi:hypothetical protein
LLTHLSHSSRKIQTTETETETETEKEIMCDPRLKRKRKMNNKMGNRAIQSSNIDTTPTKIANAASTLRWTQGLLLCSIFSLCYVIAPFYFCSAIIALIYQFPTRDLSFLYSLPLFLSMMFPAKQMTWLSDYLGPIVDYFQFDAINELSDEELLSGFKQDKKFIFAAQPHGVIPFVSFCCWVKSPPELRKIKNAVASSLVNAPLVKHIIGVFGITDSTSQNVRNILRHGKGADGSLILYVGGIAEMFRCSTEEERLYLKKRKGFIKVALREGVDVVPIYLFGNTSVFTVVKSKLLTYISRKTKVSFIFFWGKWMLPIPRDEQLICVRGKPLGIPHIPEPTDEDIDHWHAIYCEEVIRIFDSYKTRLPAYAHKNLIID